jgi:hypothetical protein
MPIVDPEVILATQLWLLCRQDAPSRGPCACSALADPFHSGSLPGSKEIMPPDSRRGHPLSNRGWKATSHNVRCMDSDPGEERRQ